MVVSVVAVPRGRSGHPKGALSTASGSEGGASVAVPVAPPSRHLNILTGSHGHVSMERMANLHEIEEAEFGWGSRLWDADPDVCCAAFQLGACPHTENFDPDEAFGDPEPAPSGLTGWSLWMQLDGEAPHMVEGGMTRAEAVEALADQAFPTEDWEVLGEDLAEHLDGDVSIWLEEIK